MLGDDTSLVFLHIPKTGGTSIHNMLLPYFEPELVCPWRRHCEGWRNADHLERFRFYSGHFDARDVARIPGRQAVFTVLRDPKERILSLCHFWRSHTSSHTEAHNLSGPRAARRFPLRDFLRHCGDDVPYRVDNVIVRTLIGQVWHGDGVGAEGQFVGDETAALTRAKEALGRLGCFGLLEDMGATVKLIWQWLGIAPSTDVRHDLNHRMFHEHASLERMQRARVDSESERELDRLTRLDRPLYAHARELFRERVRSEL